MNMKTAVGIAFAAAFATVAPLSAQEVKQTLSLDEAIAVTLTENPAMKAAEFEEKAAMQERRAAIGLRMPQINVTGAYAYLGKDIGFDFNEMTAAGQRTDTARSDPFDQRPAQPAAERRLVPHAAGPESGVRGWRGDHADLAGR